MSDKLLSIGEVSATTGIKVSAVRYYDELGLIDVAARVGGSRRFALETVGRINFIQRCQRAGFSLDEIAMMLDDSAGEWRAVVDAKIAQLTERRYELDAVLSMLGEIRTCGCDVVATCPRSATW